MEVIERKLSIPFFLSTFFLNFLSNSVFIQIKVT